MTDYPIIFSPPMVRALLREVAQPGTGKTMTRRLAWRCPCEPGAPAHVCGAGGYAGWKSSIWAKVKPGDLLWVKEAIRFNPEHSNFYYEADNKGVGDRVCARLIEREKERGRPYVNLGGRYVPRFTTRLVLTVNGNKVEQPQDISAEDASAEGCQCLPCEGPHRGPEASYWTMDERSAAPIKRTTPFLAFKAFWEVLHSERGWEANPTVAAPSFTPALRDMEAV